MRPDPRKYIWDALHAAERLDTFRQGKSFQQEQFIPGQMRVLLFMTICFTLATVRTLYPTVLAGQSR